MNKIIIALVFCMTFTYNASAQEDEKVKGDRNVTIKQTYIDPFNKIVVGEDFYVEVYYNKKPSVEVEADDNLHEYISFEVKDSVLTLKTTKKIVSSKKMNIKVNYDDAFQHIQTLDDAEIRSLTSLELKNATLNTYGNSKAYLNIKAKTFKFQCLDKSKVKLNVEAESSVLQLSGNSKLDALINSKETEIDMYQRANADIEGTTKKATITCDNNTKFNGSNFTIESCILKCSLSSDAYAEVINDITIDVSGTSSIYLYGNPKITINQFLDTAKLQKKEK